MYNTTFKTKTIESVIAKAENLLAEMKSGQAVAGKISTTNSKLNELAKMLGVYKTQVVAFDVLAGSTCPFADICKAWVNVDNDGNRTVKAGKDCKFTCYAASLEARYGNVYKAHKHNTEIVDQFCQNKDVEGLAAWLIASIWYKSPTMRRKGGFMRWHASGDFFKKTYVEAAALVQQALPHVEFFGYSKSPWVVKALTNGFNAHMVHSHGSKFDAQAIEMGIPQSFVKCSAEEYNNIPLACAHPTSPDDYVFIKAQASFAINVH